MELNPIVVTQKGEALSAKALSGQCQIEFTKAGTGDGEWSTSLYNATALKSQKQEIAISSVKAVNDNTAQITAVISNRGLETGYYLREIGIFAREKGDAGTEILYGIITAKIPANLAPYTSGTPFDMTLRPVIAVSKAATVTFAPDSGAYADIASVTALQDKVSGMLHTVDITVPASGWSSAAPYTQVITVAGMKASDTPLIGPAIDKATSAADVKAYKKVAGLIDGGDTSDGAIEIYCNTARPSVDAKIRLMGVSVDG